MIYVVAILKVKNVAAFNEFESQAIQILKSHGGVLVSAFEADPSDVSSSDNIEVHYIQFPTIESYNSYRADPALEQLADLRSNAIHSTKLYVSERLKEYGE